MATTSPTPDSTPVESLSPPPRIEGALNRNLWAVSITSFFADVSTDMVVNLVPLFLANVLGVQTALIGLIEGLAETTASLLKPVSGWLSDRLGKRKWVAVSGYAISALAKPFYLVAATWGVVAGVRWADRVGKGIRTAPRDALLAESISAERRGFAFGFQRSADTLGAVVGLLIALLVIWRVQQGSTVLTLGAFRRVALLSLIPAFLAVLALAIMARDVPKARSTPRPALRLRGMGRPFERFLVIVTLFTLGNSSDAFLVLRAQERGVSSAGIMAILVLFNVVYALVSTPAGSLSDTWGRKRVIGVGWMLYALIYLGFALAQSIWQVWTLYALYGIYYGLTYGAAKAMVADLVPAHQRGTAYGAYNAVIGLAALPASLLAGILWQGVFGWRGFGPAAPFVFGAFMAAMAGVALWRWDEAVVESRMA